ncbi:caspase domain-containing protein [Bacteroidota bacterium]
MSLNFLKFITLFMVLLAIKLSLLCQIVGESEVTTIIIKKPGISKSGNDDLVYRDIRDIAPPEIKIISPQVDTSFTAHVSASNIYLIGRLTDESGIQSLFINDKIIDTDENGFFQQPYNLADGLNVFQIDASDALSNSFTKSLYLIKDVTIETGVIADQFDYKGEYYGLIIGIDNYNDPDLVDLDHPITDATLLYSTLIGNYMFEPENLILLKDPTRADIIENLDILSYRLTENDNLLIFYAGHGYWDERKETGYWLPADAEQFSSVNWIRNSTIQGFVDDINTRHTLLISDACFAGSIFKTRGAFQDASIAVNKLYSLSSRKAMTSGTLKEVPDKSVFIEFFIKRLLDNNKKYMSSGELFSSFREAVLNNSPNTPQYGVIQDTGDEGGEFIFIKR